MIVLVFPVILSFAFSSSVINAVWPGLEETKLTVACTFESIEPGAN